MKYLISLSLAVFFFASCYAQAEDNLVFYNAGKRDPAAWDLLRDYFSSKNYALSFYQGEVVMERHLEKANRINAVRSGAVVAIEFIFSEDKQVTVATAESERNDQTGGRPRLLWGVGELPAKHEVKSKRLADSVAAQFRVAVKKMPLFPFVGIDLPGVFVSIHCSREEAGALLASLDMGLQKYYRRDKS